MVDPGRWKNQNAEYAINLSQRILKESLRAQEKRMVTQEPEEGLREVKGKQARGWSPFDRLLGGRGFCIWGASLFSYTLTFGAKGRTGPLSQRAVRISIYIYAVELKAGPRSGVSSVKNWSKSSVKNWSKFFFTVFPQFLQCFLGFLKTQIVSHCAKIVFLQNFGDVKKEVFEKKIAFFIFVFLCWRNRNRKKKKKKMEKAKNPIKIVFFEVAMQKCEKMDFLQNCLTQFVSGRERKNAHFRAHYLFWPKNVLGPKQCKPGKTIKIVVSAEIGQNQKWHLFFEKGVLWHGWKSGFY